MAEVSLLNALPNFASSIAALVESAVTKLNVVGPAFAPFAFVPVTVKLQFVAVDDVSVDIIHPYQNDCKSKLVVLVPLTERLGMPALARLTGPLVMYTEPEWGTTPGATPAAPGA